MRGNRKVFVSHAHDDNSLCTPLLHALDAWEVDYWFDTSRIDAGDNLGATVSKAIMERDIFIRVCTATAQESRWVGMETNAFRGLLLDRNDGPEGKRKLINLVLKSDYKHEAYDYVFTYINAVDRDQRDWFAELRRALGINNPQSFLSGERVGILAFGSETAVRAWNGKYVSVDRSNGERLYAVTTEIVDAAIFELVDPANPFSNEKIHYGDKVALRSVSTSKYASAKLKTENVPIATVPHLRGWETFKLVRPGYCCRPEDASIAFETCFALRAANEQYVGCDLNGDQGLTAVVSLVKHWETFTFEPIP